MSQQIICDGCGEPIDPTVSYYAASVQTVQEIDGVVTAGGPPVQRDYHIEHLPTGVAVD